MELKKCTKCLIEKDLSQYSKDKGGVGGFCYWCKTCASASSLAYHNRHKTRIKKRNKEYKESNPIKYLVWCARYRAKNHNEEFSITEDDISMPNECPILKIPLFMGPLHNPNSPSIDRIDNGKGYIKGNVHVVSYRANVLKRDASVEELALLSKWINKTYAS